MGLDDRFGGYSKNNSQADKPTESNSSASINKSDKDGKNFGLGTLGKNPYAQNAKDALTGHKSKGQAATDAGKTALKNHGKNLLKKAATPTARYGAMGLGYAYLADKALKATNMFLNMLVNNPVSNVIGNLISMAGNAWSAVSGTFGGIGHAIANGVGAVLHGIGSALHGLGNFVGGVAHAVTGSSSVAASASIVAQVTAVISPVIVVGSLVTAVLAPKNADNLACQIAQIGNPTYGKLGNVTRDPKDSNKTAQNVYNAFRKGGYTKNVALAITANLMKESGFRPDNRNSIGAFGIAQWMGGRYKNLETYASQHHAKVTDFSTQVNFVNEELQHAYKNVLDKATKAGSLADATDAITNGYEVPGEQEDKPRQLQAETYETMMSNSRDDAASNNDNLAQSAADALCGNDDSSNLPDWTGSIRENIPSIGAHYSTDDVPSDIKKFVKSPELVGMTYNQGGAGWDVPSANDPMQCVSFAVPYFIKIHKNMTMKDWLTGNGQDIAANAATKFGGKTSNVPHAGALASAKAGSTDNMLESGAYGHVFVVSHVLKDGTVIGLEENMTWNHKNLSGTWTHSVNWDYVVLPKATYEKWKIEFYTPDNKKYPLNFNGNH